MVKRLLITGDVQGVGFRYSLIFAAKKLGLAGWVRNRWDGSVEAVVQGDEESVKDLIAWAWKGPDMATVKHVEVTEEAGHYTGFELKDTV